MTRNNYIVPPRSREEIRAFALQLRKHVDIKEGRFPIIGFIEMILPQLNPSFELIVADRTEMGDNLGLTYPDQHKIFLREDVYDNACDGKGFDRMTAAHEVAHYLLHSSELIGFARSTADKDVERYRTSEWQANCFAGELLIPFSNREKIIEASPTKIASFYGVTEQAARFQQKVFMGKRPSSCRN